MKLGQTISAASTNVTENVLLLLSKQQTLFIEHISYTRVAQEGKPTKKRRRPGPSTLTHMQIEAHMQLHAQRYTHAHMCRYTQIHTVQLTHTLVVHQETWPGTETRHLNRGNGPRRADRWACCSLGITQFKTRSSFQGKQRQILLPESRKDPDSAQIIIR